MSKPSNVLLLGTWKFHDSKQGSYLMSDSQMILKCSFSFERRPTPNSKLICKVPDMYRALGLARHALKIVLLEGSAPFECETALDEIERVLKSIQS